MYITFMHFFSVCVRMFRTPLQAFRAIAFVAHQSTNTLTRNPLNQLPIYFALHLLAYLVRVGCCDSRGFAYNPIIAINNTIIGEKCINAHHSVYDHKDNKDSRTENGLCLFIIIIKLPAWSVNTDIRPIAIDFSLQSIWVGNWEIFLRSI